MRAFGGPAYVPSCKAALLAERNRAITTSYTAGEPFDVLWRQYTLSRRHLWRLLKIAAGHPRGIGEGSWRSGSWRRLPLSERR